jgi:outer membrane murein-binding lipoprotein Lpp
MENMKTKKAIIIRTLAIAIIAGGIFTGCMSQAQKEEAARVKVENAKSDLKDAKIEANSIALKTATAEEWKIFKSESEVKIKDNDVRIAELKVQLNKPGRLLDPLYVKRIETLEAQNKSMQTRIIIYEKNQSDWETFKREFNHDMDALGKALKDVFTDNKS